MKSAEEITSYKKMDIIAIKGKTVKEAKLLIEIFLRNYLKTHKQVYPSDVADELELDYEVTRKVFDILEHEGKLEKAK